MKRKKNYKYNEIRETANSQSRHPPPYPIFYLVFTYRWQSLLGCDEYTMVPTVISPNLLEYNGMKKAVICRWRKEM